MKLRMPDYYRAFRCVGSRCPDTCCRDWEVVLDPETAARYRSVPGVLGEEIRAAMKVFDGEDCFFLRDGLCPMLNEQGLCRIQLELGEEALSHSCSLHPRFAEEYGALREWSLSMACPEAVRLLLAHPSPVAFVEEATGERVASCNDLDPKLYFALLDAREIAFVLVQDRDAPWQVRARRLLAFGEALQRQLDQHRIGRLNDVTARFAAGRYPKELPALPEGRALLLRLAALEPINDRWPDLLASAMAVPEDALDAFHAETKALNYEYEHLLVYYVFRYFLKAVNDRQLLPRVRLAVYSVLCVQALEYAQWRRCGSLRLEDRIDRIHRYSREVEHSKENLEAVLAWT